MKTEQERIDFLADRIRNFNIAVSGDGIVSGGFGKIPDKSVTLEHLQDAFTKFRIAGDQGVQAHGNLQHGYVLSGTTATTGGEEDPDVPPPS